MPGDEIMPNENEGTSKLQLNKETLSDLGAPEAQDGDAIKGGLAALPPVKQPFTEGCGDYPTPTQAFSCRCA